MSLTKNTSQKNSNRNQPMLSDGDERRRDGLLRSAWLQTVAGFPCRPHPRSVWDETATGDQTPWRYVITPIRAAILQAVESGDKELIAKTLEGARAFTRELEADFTSLVKAPEEESALATALVETECEGPANAVEAMFIASPSPTNAERALAPLERQFKHLGLLIERCRKLARSHPSMVPMNGGVR